LSAPREIACPGSRDGALHFAEYDRDAGTLACTACGFMAAEELRARLALEFARAEAAAVTWSTREDEKAVEAMAARLLALLPGEAPLAIELAVGWALHAFAGRLPAEHAYSAAGRVLDRIAA